MIVNRASQQLAFTQEVGISAAANNIQEALLWWGLLLLVKSVLRVIQCRGWCRALVVYLSPCASVQSRLSAPSEIRWRVHSVGRASVHLRSVER